MKAVLRRCAPQLGDDVVEVSGLRFDPGARRVTAGGREIQFRRIEFGLLHFFLTHPNRTFSRGQLLDQVWGDHVFVEERTVDVHVRRLRRALVPSRHDRLIETVRGVGYRFRSSAATTPAPARCATVTDLVRVRGSRALQPVRVNAA
jgi:two-component system phosphate regulon response regulator PhoB